MPQNLLYSFLKGFISHFISDTCSETVSKFLDSLKKVLLKAVSFILDVHSTVDESLGFSWKVTSLHLKIHLKQNSNTRYAYLVLPFQSITPSAKWAELYSIALRQWSIDGAGWEKHEYIYLSIYLATRPLVILSVTAHTNTLQ